MAARDLRSKHSLQVSLCLFWRGSPEDVLSVWLLLGQGTTGD